MSTLQLVRPARGHVTQRYAATQVDGEPHAGQDYAYYSNGVICDEVFAAADGVVIFAGDSRDLSWPNIMFLNIDFDRTDSQDSSAGNYTIIAHYDAAGNQVALTGYGHQEQIWVKAGQVVKASQQIGVIGATGFSAGKHLHFDFVLWPFDVNDAPFYGRVDPNPYFTDIINYNYGTITPIPEEDEFMASIEDLMEYPLELINGGKSTFQTQILNVSEDISTLLKRQADDRSYAEKVNGKIDALFGLLTNLPDDVMKKKIITIDGRETTLETELQYMPANFANANDDKDN